MKTRIVSVSIVAALSACAQPVYRAPYAQQYMAPTCSSDVECSRKWAAAREKIQALTGMKIRSATDDYMETFTRRGPPIMGIVNKIANADGSYTIRGRIACNSSAPNVCGDLPGKGTDAFNAALGGKRISSD